MSELIVVRTPQRTYYIVGDLFIVPNMCCFYNTYDMMLTISKSCVDRLYPIGVHQIAHAHEIHAITNNNGELPSCQDAAVLHLITQDWSCGTYRYDSIHTHLITLKSVWENVYNDIMGQLF